MLASIKVARVGVENPILFCFWFPRALAAPGILFFFSGTPRAGLRPAVPSHALPSLGAPANPLTHAHTHTRPPSRHPTSCCAPCSLRPPARPPAPTERGASSTGCVAPATAQRHGAARRGLGQQAATGLPPLHPWCVSTCGCYPPTGAPRGGGSMLAQRPRAARPVTALRLAHSRNARAPAPGTGPHTPPPPHRAPRQGLRRSDPARAWAKGV